MSLYPGWSARDNYGYGAKKKKRKKEKVPGGGSVCGGSAEGRELRGANLRALKGLKRPLPSIKRGKREESRPYFLSFSLSFLLFVCCCRWLADC
jgi:hypothetical protein